MVPPPPERATCPVCGRIFGRTDPKLVRGLVMVIPALETNSNRRSQIPWNYKSMLAHLNGSKTEEHVEYRRKNPDGPPCQLTPIPDTLESVLRKTPDILPEAAPRAVHLVNRLDRGTSGIVVVAVDGKAAAKLQRAWPDASKECVRSERAKMRANEREVCERLSMCELAKTCERAKMCERASEDLRASKIWERAKTCERAIERRCAVSPAAGGVRGVSPRQPS
jgi:hypothetical protein